MTAITLFMLIPSSVVYGKLGIFAFYLYLFNCYMLSDMINNFWFRIKRDYIYALELTVFLIILVFIIFTKKIYK